MAPLEPWEKVLVKKEFMDTVHGNQSCIACHGGVQSDDKETAHANMIADPSADSQQCAACHAEQGEHASTNLHASLNGYWTELDARSTPENRPPLEEAFNNHCASCHTTCGDCHISQPGSVGGGLLDGHVFVKTPPMTRTCTACHGSRVGAEYLGKHEGIPGDVHFRQGRMSCVSCHKGETLHTTPESEIANRYAGAQSPSCEYCHNAVNSEFDKNQQHLLHKDKVSCQVCHTVEYTSCDGCHVSISAKSGNPIYETQADYLTFYIGLNPLQNEERPYKYVPLRHIPIDTQSFAYYGDNLLPNFNNLPTWKYATPHNVQRNTPQTSSCSNCHGNADLFLTTDKVKPEELEANKSVIVSNPPAAMGSQ